MSYSNPLSAANEALIKEFRYEVCYKGKEDQIEWLLTKLSERAEMVAKEIEQYKNSWGRDVEKCAEIARSFKN